MKPDFMPHTVGTSAKENIFKCADRVATLQE